MQIGMVGLGRMGANMARRLMRGGHACVAFDLSADNVDAVVADGAIGAESLVDLAKKLEAPRAVWVMVPSGGPTRKTIAALAEVLAEGDVIIDGGNSHFKEDVKHAAELAPRGIHYLDVGTSGGVWGLAEGYCLMVGGERAIFDRLEPVFATLAPGLADVPRTPGRDGDPGPPERGYLYCGSVGAGHYVKMVHNGIEYGVMQAYAEGFDIMRNATTEQLPEELRYDLPMGDIAEVWRRGSVIRSWLLDLTAAAMVDDPGLSDYSGFVQDSGEGRWTLMAAIEQAVPADVISAALYARFRSRQEHTYAEKVLSAMRRAFGGHLERPGKK